MTEGVFYEEPYTIQCNTHPSLVQRQKRFLKIRKLFNADERYHFWFSRYLREVSRFVTIRTEACYEQTYCVILSNSLQRIVFSLKILVKLYQRK